MKTLIERLQDSEMYVDAVDEAIREILTLRRERDEAVELLRKHQRKYIFNNGELMDIVCVECESNMMFNLKHDPDCRLKLILDKHRIP